LRNYEATSSILPAMKAKVILSKLSAVAGVINEFIASSELAVRIGPLVIAGDSVSTSLSQERHLCRNSGSPLQVEAVSGTEAAVNKRLDQLLAANPYWSILATAPLPPAKETETSAKKSGRVFALFLLVQP
jgi:hypothetical protein